MLINAEKLADLIDESTESIEVCVPPEWYDDSHKAFYTTTVQFINPNRLADLLREAAKDSEDGISE